MPKEPSLQDARFVVGAARPNQFPNWSRPEIAFAGRSNVGKSSLLRALLGQRRLVRVSRTPGRTRELNFFEVTLEGTECAFVDLPGYGYAQVPRALRDAWGQLLQRYLVDRRQLAGVVLLIDVRRTPGAEERELLETLAGLGRPVHVVATKVDQLPKTRLETALRQLQRDLDLRTRPLAFSALTGQGSTEVLHRLLRLLRPTAASSPGPAPAPSVPSPDRAFVLARATPADLDQIEAIERLSFRSPWSREMLADELQRAWAFVWVARQADAPTVIGYLDYWVVYDELHLLNLATDPAHRRAGVARRLMEDMIARGRQGSAQLVVLEVRRSNTAAQTLYERLGFQAIGERKGYYQDTHEDALVYQLLL
jgi:GTP-binding protein